MNEIGLKIKLMRQITGMTQARLSQESGVSVPTIQNLEAGKANPSLHTLTALLGCLGLGIELRHEAPDWHVLTACGLPLVVNDHGTRAKPSLQALARELRRAVQQNLSEREAEALCALLWAIEAHYPKLFAAEFGGSAFAKYSKRPRTGRLVKLRRNALAILSEYL